MAALRQGRSTKPSSIPGTPARFSRQAKSLAGARLQGTPQSAGPLPELPELKTGIWGQLPKKLAEELTTGRGDQIPDDYRTAIETYYRVIAERSQQP